jgi:hypothetical protein
MRFPPPRPKARRSPASVAVRRILCFCRRDCKANGTARVPETAPAAMWHFCVADEAM